MRELDDPRLTNDSPYQRLSPLRMAGTVAAINLACVRVIVVGSCDLLCLDLKRPRRSVAA